MKQLAEVADEARALGVKVVAERCDVASEADVTQFVDQTRKELGAVHVAINNAVNRGAEGNFLEESYEAWVTNFEVNLTGPRNVCRHVLPMMKEQRWGRIINLSGTSPFLGGSVSKGMAKLGIIGFTRGVAREFAPWEITANCIGPGTIEVERDDFQKPKGLKASQPIRRLGKPGEIVSMMVYLSSENAGFITGQCYLVNGGMYFQ
jgi:NAD(P)-dependent dehydrogenase (short-subunit alcohol dehydrogenase family)